MIKIIVTGAAGRMGSRIIALAKADKGLEVAGAVDISDSLEKVISLGDVVIDFSQPDATITNLEIAARNKKAAVVGTTGHSPEQRQSIESLGKKIPLVIASNMSVGVNVLWKIIADAAKLLGDGFDVEIVEAHHRLKKDAPSGTAMTTAEVLAKALGRDLSKDAVYHREGLIGERKPREIGIQTIRGGDVVGDHTVFFLGTGERLEVTHRATSRDTFALGALRAARWIVGKPNGCYTMADVLGLK